MAKVNVLKKTNKRRHYGKENAEPDVINNSLLENILGDNINDIVGRRSDVGKRSLLVDADESITDVEINDDALEKEERRRREEEERAQERKRAAASRQPGPSLLNNLTQDELDQHYSKCIEMCNKNKVNVKNAFKLQLIDYMKLILTNQSKKSENLTLMSCTLGASAKIYAHRVDKVYSDMVKIVSGKGEIEKDNDSDEENVAKESEVAVRAKRKRTCTDNSDEDSDKQTSPVDMEKMLLSEAQLDKGKGESEPIEKSALSQCPEFFIDCRQMDPDGRFSLNPPIFSRVSFNKISNTLSDPIEESYYNGNYCTLDVARYIKEFKNIEKSYSVFDEEEGADLSSQIHNSSLAFDPSLNVDIPDSIRLQPEDDMDLDDKCSGDQWVADYDDEGNSDGGENNEPKSGDLSKNKCKSFNPANMARFVSANAGDYFFFDKDRIDLMAGPRHWTIKRNKGARKVSKSASDPGRKTTKKNVNLEFNEERTKEIKKLYNDAVGALLSRKTMMTWSTRKCKIPQDITYTHRRLLSLMKNENHLYVKNDGNNIIGASDLNGDAKSLLSPDDFAGEMDEVDDDDEDGEEDNCLRNGNEPPRSPTPADIEFSAQSGIDCSSDLIPQPPKVEKINLKYAKNQKKIDIKLLKKTIWDSMALDKEDDVKVKFSDVYSSLGQKLPTEEAAELNVPIAFMALLHMANEHNLDLQGTSDYSDVSVSLSK